MFPDATKKTVSGKEASQIDDVLFPQKKCRAFES
jgi:hypothetical protein